MIVYFSGYFTSPELVEKLPGDYGILASYLEVRGKRRLPEVDKLVFLDSGAFSVMTGKASVDVKVYGDYLGQHRDKVAVYANLDVIGDPHGTAANQEYLEGRGFAPLPTFHFGSDYHHLEALLDRYEYFGLGGLVPIARKRDTLFRHLDNCFNLIFKRGGSLPRTHGWGMTGKDCLFRYPFYSVDSTSWLMGGKFRQRYAYDCTGLKNKKGGIAGTLQYHAINIHNASQIYRMVSEATFLWAKRGIAWNA